MFFFVILALFCFLRQDIMYTKLVSNTLLAQDDFELLILLLPYFLSVAISGVTVVQGVKYKPVWRNAVQCCALPTEPKILVPN